MDQNKQNQDPYAGLYADASGRGVVVAQPVAAPNTAQFNQQSMRPQGGLNQGTVNASPSFMGGPNDAAAQAQNESFLEALFNGENLSEEFMEKAATIFTAALNERVSEMEQAILAANAEVLNEEVTAGIEAGVEAGLNHLVEHVDQYLTHVGKEWLVENKLEVESGFRTEIAENFMNGLKDLFENSFIEVPEEKRDMVDDLFTANDEIEASLNATIKENIELRSTLIGHLCTEQFVQLASGLADTEVERLAKLAEGIEFDSIEQYTQKVKLLKESYFGQGSNTTNNGIVDDYSPSTQSAASTPLMENYVNALSRQLKLTNIKK